MKHEHYLSFTHGFKPFTGDFGLPYRAIYLPRLGIEGWPAIYDPTATSENYDYCLEFLGWGQAPGIYQEDLMEEERKYLADLFKA